MIPARAEYREILLIAFTVVAGTLFLQGLSLGWVARRLNVQPPDPMDDALARATVLQQASKAYEKGSTRWSSTTRTGMADVIRQQVDQRNFAAWERLGTTRGRRRRAGSTPASGGR